MAKARYALGATFPSKPPKPRKPTFGSVITPPTSQPPPSFAPSPVDPVYDQQIGSLQRNRDDTLAGLAGQQTATLANYGYNAAFDDKGGVTGLSVDPSNPFSESARLLKHYQQSKSATTNSMAARGQLYSGALQQAQDQNDVGFQQGQDSLQKRLVAALGDIQARRRGALTEFETGAGAASADRLSRSAENPLYSPTPAVAKPEAFVRRDGTNSRGESGQWHIYPNRKPVFVKKGK